MIQIFVTKTFDKLVKYVLKTYDIDTSFKVVVLDETESQTFFNERISYGRYLDEYLGAVTKFQEHGSEPDSFIACEIPCKTNQTNIKKIKEELNPDEIKTFNSTTKFMQRLFQSYEVEHLILLNDENFSSVINVKRPNILAHETYHIMEYETYDQTHTGDEIDEYAQKLVELYYISLKDDEIEGEYDKICSTKKGNRKYGRLRIITKFHMK